MKDKIPGVISSCYYDCVEIICRIGDEEVSVSVPNTLIAENLRRYGNCVWVSIAKNGDLIITRRTQVLEINDLTVINRDAEKITVEDIEAMLGVGKIRKWAEVYWDCCATDRDPNFEFVKKYGLEKMSVIEIVKLAELIQNSEEKEKYYDR
jgi:hypothetical protein